MLDDPNFLFLPIKHILFFYKMKQYILALSFLITNSYLFAQPATIQGFVSYDGVPIAHATISLQKNQGRTISDVLGAFTLTVPSPGSYKLQVSHIGFNTYEKSIIVQGGTSSSYHIYLIRTDTLDEVVVTGVARASHIKENPVAIVAISKKQIQQSTEPNIIDVLSKIVLGVSSVKTGPNVSKPFIRGLGYNRVLTLYNGIRQEGQQWGDEHGIEVDAYNLDRAEVIKGPASIMYGSDALAGVVSLITQTPTLADGRIHASLTSEYQTNNNLAGTGIRMDFKKNNFFISMNGSFRIAKNYRNKIDGRVYNTNFNEKNIGLLVGKKTEKEFFQIGLTLYDNGQGIPDGSRDSLSRKFTYQTEEGDKDIVDARPIVQKRELNGYQLSALHQRIQHYRAYVQSLYKIGNKGAEIDINLAAQQNIRKEYNHPTKPHQAGMNVRLNTLNYGLKLNHQIFKNIESSWGINGMFQNNKNKDATDFPIPDYTLLDAGAFFYSKWKKEKWSVSGGFRYDIRRIKWNDFYIYENENTGFTKQSLSANTPNSTLQFPHYKKTLKGVSGSIGVAYKLNDNIHIKANIGRAYRAPNINEIASNGLDPGARIIYLGNRNFEPEFSLQEDIGAGFKYPNFSLELSFFNNHIQNYIYQSLEVDAQGNTIVDAQGNRTYKYQQAKAQLYGSEVWFSIHPQSINGLQFNNNLAIIYGFNRKGEFKNKGTNGSHLPLIPPAQILSSVSKKTLIPSSFLTALTPRVEAETALQQNRYFGYNHSETATPAYTLFNCGLQADLNLGGTQSAFLQVQVNNLLNTAYQSHLNRLKYFEHYSQSPNGYLGIYDMGRNICMKFCFSF